MTERTKGLIKGMLTAAILLVVWYLPFKKLLLIGDDLTQDLLDELYLTILGIIGLVILHKTSVLTPKGTKPVEGLKAAVFLLIVLISPFISLFTGHNITAGPAQIIKFLLYCLFIGTAEEFMFRGIILNTLLDYFGRDNYKSVKTAIIIAGTLFGLWHLVNLCYGMDLSTTLQQVATAVGRGIMFAAVYYRSRNSIWLCVIIHTMNDALVFIKNGMLDISMQSTSKEAIGMTGGSSSILLAFSIGYIVLFIVLAVFVTTRRKAIEAVINEA